MRRILTCLFVLCLVPAVALAQDGRWKLGGDGSCAWDPYDGGPNQCLPALEPVRAEVQNQILTMAVEAEALCEEDAGGDEDKKFACGEVIIGGVGIAIAATGGTNLIANMAGGYCACAELYYGLSDYFWSVGSWMSAQLDALYNEAYNRYMNAIFTAAWTNWSYQ